MGVTSVQGFKFKLVADGEILDLFKDEEIKLSNNITGLFDLGILPSDFTRTITLPGSKRNNHFFEFVYDISVENPYTFSTNQKVPCYLDFDGIYLSDGYIQLNKVNIYQNKFIDSYEVTIYGGLSSFGRDLKRNFLTDLTTLSQYNHTASYSNISASWDGALFSGSIVYPMAEYGQKLVYSNIVSEPGINREAGSLCVQDFKPAIRMINVWDAIFEQFGYTYTSSFLSEPWIQDVYLFCNNQFRYPIFNTGSNGTSSVDLETYGLFKMNAYATSSTQYQSGQLYELPFYNITQNPSGILSSSLEFQLDFDTNLRGEVNLNFELAPSGSPFAAGFGVPQFDVITQGYVSAAWVNLCSTPLNGINQYMDQINTYNSGSTKTQTFNLTDTFSQVLGDGALLGGLPANTPLRFRLLINSLDLGINHFTVTFDKTEARSYFAITKVNQGGDGLIMDIPSNMPQGPSDTSGGLNGIKLIDFVTSIQKKFNLVIYPNKTKLNEFIVEPFNRWYKEGNIKNFNSYINLNDKIEAIPANNLAVQNLNFGDTLDGDYISQQFAKGAGREFGKAYYVDQENFFSQGTFEVKTGLASSPLIYLQGTGISGSGTIVSSSCPTCDGVIENPYCYQINYGGEGPASSSAAYYIGCNGSSSVQWMGGGVVNAWICAEYGSVTLGGSQISWTLLEPCVGSSTGSAVTESINKIYIPTYISSITYQPVKVLPHLYFYNGRLPCDTWWVQAFIESGSIIAPLYQDTFPYFDNYNVFGGTNTTPTADNLSLLFNNEQSVYGTTPTNSLYSTYWSTYVDLLYGPKTKLFDCSAIIPLADYFYMNLNDIVEWRGNYYHLRAINDYNLSNGECKLQLLGPVIADVISNVLPGLPCEFNFDIGTYTPAESASFIVAQCFGAAQLQVSFTSSLSMSIGESFTFPTSYELDDCWYVSSSFSGALDLSDVSISQSFVDCTACSASLHPTPSTGSFYYTGLICGGSIVGEFYSDTNLGDNPGVIYAYSATAGGTNQCFDNVTRIYTINTNPILAVYGDCLSCNNCSSTQWKIDNSSSGTDCFWGGTDCAGGVLGGTVGAYSIAYTPCVKDGTLTTTGFPVVTVDVYC